ncbi:unnamed protein product [Caenorhabditis brenneri]
MSLSRPATFPLLKLPFLCIEPVIKSWDIFDIIFFALTSKRTRQIVKHLKIPLNGIKIIVREENSIELDRRRWRQIFLCSETMEFHCIPSKCEKPTVLNEVFKCSIKEVAIEEDYFPLSGNIGVKSTEKLCINQKSLQPFGYAQSKKLKLLLENLEVTGTCSFWISSTKNDFYVDPKLFKCKKLVFRWGSAAWVTPEILMQFEVPQLKFDDCPFSVQDILSFVTNWFHSNNKKLENLYIEFRMRVSLDEFQTPELDLSPFSKRNRVPSESFDEFIDFSKGLEIVRHDGLSASMHVKGRAFLFYVWHDQ